MKSDALTEQQKDAYIKLLRLFTEIDEEARAKPDEEYWQGKKDGLRIGRIFMAEALGFDDEADSLEKARESSWGSRSTSLEILRAKMESAMYYIGEALWMDETGAPLHPMSRVNWMRWYNGYKQLAEKGLVPEVNDTCFD